MIILYLTSEQRDRLIAELEKEAPNSQKWLQDPTHGTCIAALLFINPQTVGIQMMPGCYPSLPALCTCEHAIGRHDTEDGCSECDCKRFTLSGKTAAVPKFD